MITLISALNDSNETVGQNPTYLLVILHFYFVKSLRSCYLGNNKIMIIFL